MRRATGSALDDREQRYAYLAAGFGALVSVALWAPSFHAAAGVALAGIGVAMSGLLALAARRRSRLLTGAAAVLLSFGPWGYLWLVGLPFLVLAAWLVLRAPRPPPRPKAERAARGRRRRRGAPAGDGTGEAAADAKPAPAPAGPPRASKRYTPPRSRPGRS